jgi:hypothetical protein
MSQSDETAEATSFAEAMENLDLKTRSGDCFAARSCRFQAKTSAFVWRAVRSRDGHRGLEGSTSAIRSKQRSSRPAPRSRSAGNSSKARLARTASRRVENRLPVEGKVTGRNKGGFEVNISGLRAFCPLSQIALGKIENPDAFVNQTIEFRVTELSDDGRRIVVSRAALLKEAAAERAAETRHRIVPGAELTGKVKTLRSARSSTSAASMVFSTCRR